MACGAVFALAEIGNRFSQSTDRRGELALICAPQQTQG
jgi:hypothetical protein